MDMIDMKNEAREETFRKSNPAQSVVVSTEVPQQRESKTHQTLQPAKMKPVSMSEELNPKPPMEATKKYTHTDTITHRQTGAHCMERFSLQCTKLFGGQKSQ